VPKTHQVAAQFAQVAEAADRFASGPAVQSGGSIQADGMSGSLVQREATVRETTPFVTLDPASQPAAHGHLFQGGWPFGRLILRGLFTFSLALPPLLSLSLSLPLSLSSSPTLPKNDKR
jgi:hypothetical protein